jgi:murein DD-endopeptidase MepM/ murein hydrolase activator NlpD
VKSSTLLLLVLFVLLVSGAVFYFRDTSGPQVVLAPASGPISGKVPLDLKLADSPSGLKKVVVTASQKGSSVVLLTKSFSPAAPAAEETIPLAKAGFKDGPLTIRVDATDHSVYHFGKGNTTDRVFTYDYDTTPPAISVLGTEHNISRGGSGIVVYTVSEQVEKTGVTVGKLFFPGYHQKGNVYACLFAFPYYMKSAQFPIPKVIAVDRAGNQGIEGFFYHLIPKTFRRARIQLSDQFLEAKKPEFQSKFPNVTSPLQLFLKVNRTLRVKDRAELHTIGLQTSPVPLWHGAFLRQPDAATEATFGDHRTYFYHGKTVDQETHLGMDLASVAHAPIRASNAGKVVYAAPFGIYGRCVILDHGMGLQTLYGHMNRIAVKPGDVVKKGQVIGYTGTTGLAGGDHLHFGVLVSGLPVNPVEWWDPHWIRNNILSKLALEKKALAH